MSGPGWFLTGVAVRAAVVVGVVKGALLVVDAAWGGGPDIGAGLVGLAVAVLVAVAGGLWDGRRMPVAALAWLWGASATVLVVLLALRGAGDGPGFAVHLLPLYLAGLLPIGALVAVPAIVAGAFSAAWQVRAHGVG